MLQGSEIIDLFFHHLPVQKIKAGEVIFSEGEIGRKMFAIMEGEVQLYLNGNLREIISQHDMFGEEALVESTHRRLTTAIAKTECQLVELDQERFLFLVQETPLFALEVIRSLSIRLRNLK